MPRRARPATTTRSEYWLRLLINRATGFDGIRRLNNAFHWGGDVVHWVSPLAKDSYAEYYDESFLDVLGLTPAQVPLHNFWPLAGHVGMALA